MEKEPAGLLISLAISGIIATFLAMMAESVGYLLVSSVFWEGSILYNFFLFPKNNTNFLHTLTESLCLPSANNELHASQLKKSRIWWKIY